MFVSGNKINGFWLEIDGLTSGYTGGGVILGDALLLCSLYLAFLMFAGFVDKAKYGF